MLPCCLERHTRRAGGRPLCSWHTPPFCGVCWLKDQLAPGLAGCRASRLTSRKRGGAAIGGDTVQALCFSYVVDLGADFVVTTLLAARLTRFGVARPGWRLGGVATPDGVPEVAHAERGIRAKNYPPMGG